MVEDLKTVLLGKELEIKNKHYFSTAFYVEPFIERLAPFNVEFRCQVKNPDQFTISDGKPDLAYTRVNIQAVFPKENNKPYRKVINMVYGLDVKTPVVKFSVGALDNENDNFIVFDKDSIIIQEIEPDTPLNYNCIISLIEKTDNINAMISSIKDVFIDRNDIYNLLGQWIDFVLDNGFINECGKIKLSSSMPIDAYKLLTKDRDSEFYVSEELPISLFDVYSAFISLIRDDKDIINQFEKTILVDRLLKL